MRDKVIRELKKQGREHNDVDEILEVFREEQLLALLEGWDLWDLDEWVAMERLTGVELNEKQAKQVMEVFWYMGIAITDLPY